MSLKLKAGEWVEVRSKDEILATLDEHARLDGLPFMPEMFEYCGKRLRVFKRAHKTCDTIGPSAGRKMADAVHLEEVRCPGQDHGGCQASCMIFWKEAWLKRVPSGQGAINDGVAERLSGLRGAIPARCDEGIVRSETRTSGANDQVVYWCQATELQKATKPLPWWDIRQYLEDLMSGNVTLHEVLSSGLHSAWYHLSQAGIGLGPIMRRLYDKWQALRGGVPFPWRRGTIPAGQPTPTACLDLQAGEWARVKGYEEILRTLDRSNKNRGMLFGPEEVPYCGKTLRVRQRVERIIDEKTGKMIHFKVPAVILDGAYCQSHYCELRKFCPRAIFTFWREVWLERAEVARDSDLKPTPK